MLLMPNAAKVFQPYGRMGKRAKDTRPTAAQRGYTSTWAKASAGFIKGKLCVYCLKEGKRTPAQCTDHIQPVKGPSDPMFWKRSNWAPCCYSHNVKRGWQLVRGAGR